MGNTNSNADYNGRKWGLRKAQSLPDTQQIFDDLQLAYKKGHRSSRLFKFRSSRDVKKECLMEATISDVDALSSQRPVPLVEAMFLPEFPIRNDPLCGDYQVVEILAKGAYGNVVKVHREDVKHIYAMKILNKKQIIVEGAIAQVKDEAAIQSTLGDHPFVVKTYEYWQSRNLLYIVLDYVSYGDMFTLWQYYETLPENLVRYFIAELAIVLDYLHKAGVIYRDLKLENVLFDPNGHIQLTDFGLAKWVQIGEKTSTICGTLQYMAPEVLTIYPYGHTADWWSLGILMHTLLIGHYPVDGAEDHVEMARKVFKCEYQLPNHLSPKAQEVISKLLYKSPHRRITDLYSIQHLPFFKFINFSHLIERTVSPKDVVDVDYFSMAFTQTDSPIATIMDGDTHLIFLDEKGEIQTTECDHSNAVMILLCLYVPLTMWASPMFNAHERSGNPLRLLKLQ